MVGFKYKHLSNHIGGVIGSPCGGEFDGVEDYVFAKHTALRRKTGSEPSAATLLADCCFSELSL